MRSWLHVSPEQTGDEQARDEGGNRESISTFYARGAEARLDSTNMAAAISIVWEVPNLTKAKGFM